MVVTLAIMVYIMPKTWDCQSRIAETTRHCFDMCKTPEEYFNEVAALKEAQALELNLNVTGGELNGS